MSLKEKEIEVLQIYKVFTVMLAKKINQEIMNSGEVEPQSL